MEPHVTSGMGLAQGTKAVVRSAVPGEAGKMPHKTSAHAVVAIQSRQSACRPGREIVRKNRSLFKRRGAVR